MPYKSQYQRLREKVKRMEANHRAERKELQRQRLIPDRGKRGKIGEPFTSTPTEQEIANAKAFDPAGAEAVWIFCTVCSTRHRAPACMRSAGVGRDDDLDD